jgi:cytochrome c oxidase assembly factor CtaG
MIEAQIIGALLTFAESPIYATYQAAPRAFGLSVMQDQQVGGLIMWIPGGMLYTAIIFVVLHLALSAEERSVRAAEMRAARLAGRPNVAAVQH